MLKHWIFLVPDSGKVLKSIVNSTLRPAAEDFSPDQSVISQSWDLFPGQAIKSLRLVSPKRLLVSTETDMVMIRVANCEKFASSCSQCLQIRDPHCAWDVDNRICVAKDPDVPHKELPISLIQDVAAGDLNLCPSGEWPLKLFFFCEHAFVFLFRLYQHSWVVMVTDVRDAEVEANHLKSIKEDSSLNQQQQQGSEECCSCGTTTLSSPSSSSTGAGSEQEGSNGKELEMNSTASSNELIIPPVSSAQNESFLDNEIPRLTNFQQG